MIVAPEKKFKKLKNATIAYREYGAKDGYPVFCMPPWIFSSFIYLPLASVVNPKIKLISLEFPGWGGSSKLNKGDIDIDTYIDLAKDFINSFGLDNYSLLGVSYGGVVVQGLIQEGMKAQGVILISTINGGFSLFGDILGKTVIKGARAMQKAMRNEKMFKKVMIFARKTLVLFNYDKNRIPYIDLLLEDMGDFSIHEALKTIYSLNGRSFLSSKMKNTQVLLIRGSRDYFFVKQDMKDISKYLNNTKVVILPKADHDNIVFEPEKCAPYVNEFLDKLLPVD